MEPVYNYYHPIGAAQMKEKVLDILSTRLTNYQIHQQIAPMLDQVIAEACRKSSEGALIDHSEIINHGFRVVASNGEILNVWRHELLA